MIGLVFSVLLLGADSGCVESQLGKEEIAVRSERDEELSMPLKFTTIEKGTYSGCRDEGNLIIKTESRWLQLWNRHVSIRYDNIPLPNVDFAKEMVVAIFMGERISGGYATEVTRIEERENELVVFYLETSPPKDMIVSQALTQPYHIVKVGKSNLPINFYKLQVE